MTEIRQLNGLSLVVAEDTIVEIVFEDGNESKPRFRTKPTQSVVKSGSDTSNVATLNALDYDEVANILTEGVELFCQTGFFLPSIRKAIEKVLS